MSLFKNVLVVVLMSLTMANTAYANANEDLLDNVDIYTVKEMPVKYSAGGGKLLLSDSPENVKQDGIMYKDTVNGNARLFFHHVNVTNTPKKVVVVVENNGDSPANISMYQSGLGGPGYNYLEVGKAAQLEYMGNTDTFSFVVLPHDSELLANELGIMTVKPNMLLNGIYDFYTDSPVTIKVMMMPVTANAKYFAAHARILPKDESRLRGTFEGKDLTLVPEKTYNPLKDAPKLITLADNVVDKYIKGIDATDGSAVVNYGNYGVVYNLFLPSEHKGKVALYLSPYGGAYAGGMGIKYGQNELPPVATPDGNLYFGNGVFPEYTPLGIYDGGKPLWLKFSPPGASNLPVKILVVPDKN